MKYEIYVFTQQKIPSFYKEAIAEYTKRLGRYCKIKCEYIKKEKLWEKKIAESSPEERIFVLPGENSMTSEELSRKMSSWESRGVGRIVFFISEKGQLQNQPPADSFVCLGKSEKESFSEEQKRILNLSDFDLNPAMAAMVLHEQIYRGYRIMHNHPYHK